jgi:N-acetylglucosamine kinase-like BadF-type ATPase
MIAVVYSGSNNAGWRLAYKGRTVASFNTNAINPYFNDEKYITQLLNKNINLIHHAEEIKRIYFFGAGASSDALKQVIHNALTLFFKFAKISVDHDIAAAAIACCRNNPGIVSICASGTNAAWYDGKRVKPNNYGLGYILADEGSGNWLGKQLIKSYMSEKLPVNLQKKFMHRYDADRKTLLEKVYRQKQPALFLSSFSDFFLDNKDDAYLSSIIKTGFTKLIDTYILPLQKQHPDVPVHFAGSVASNFQEHLYETAESAGVKIATIIKEPINNLLSYYSNKN